MSDYELAQLNIAHLAAPLESPRLADFVANLDRINALADDAPGFVWRLQTEEGNATEIRDFGEEYIVNISVWKDLSSLHDFVYRSAHTAIMARRREWFQRLEEAYMVLWWVEAGHRPDTLEARHKLDWLRAHGPGEHAFTFKQAYPPPGSTRPVRLPDLGDTCPAS